MKRLLLIPLMLLALSSTAQADSCPDPRDISTEMDLLLGAVQKARNEGEARVFVNQMWHLWRDAPDATAQELLQDGALRIRISDYAGAEAILSHLIDYCPGYAEGYNQRAFALFLAGEYERSLSDLDQALALRPRHVAALAGKVLALQALGRKDEAQKVLRAALALNPWLPERHMLLTPPGTEL
ncbi:tetratricopeptide repeat protein [Aliiroseovarius lamellibrachiae]|uniref:tetratricopeptide repeat protein n=1 Tax=Aliiroseovarius lamellibrachiae TaxID=1924933 RepID=UPI001BE0BB45|nr:tetratricopeptide repeat protein [Aliiroseovarius lamellibrachiae]MBT2130048.1 tetratricopeptide repeat protein [Aliiroseovarius lamellibrachiae]